MGNCVSGVFWGENFQFSPQNVGGARKNEIFSRSSYTPSVDALA
jgi:hypothetical protein